MAEPKGGKPPQNMWPAPPADKKPAQKPAANAAPEAAKPAGRVKHDERGNAVWDWLSQTARIAIDSTSALLKRLERHDLEVEGKKDENLRVESDRDAGGGYDPYSKSPPRRNPKR